MIDGRAMGEAIVGLIICAALAGAFLASALWVSVPWLFHHLSIIVS